MPPARRFCGRRGRAFDHGLLVADSIVPDGVLFYLMACWRKEGALESTVSAFAWQYAIWYSIYLKAFVMALQMILLPFGRMITCP
jgi:hypothetical protein